MLKRHICFLFLLALMAALPAAADAERPNVLFIAIDDMNDWAGFLDTHPQIRTPHMDALAAGGVSFTNAHVPAPICGPSRTAIMSGMWPTTTGIYTNAANYRRDLPNRISLPEHFRNNGYRVMGVGKLFHAGMSRVPENAFDEYGEYGSSSSPFSKEEMDLAKQKPFHRFEKNGQEFRLPLNGFPADRFWRSTNTFDWGAVDLPDEMFSDFRAAEWAADRLRQEHDQPFFLAVGFHRPHQPLYNPKRFHDLYPLDSVALPPTIENDLGDVPRAGREYALAPNTSGLHKSVAQYGEWEHAVSSYLASISFVDELIGNIMAALKDSAYADNTLVVMWSDHGWHLGEKEHWGKATGWFRSTRIPLVIVPPGSSRPDGFEPGADSTRPVNLLDLAPTIAGMTGVPLLKAWEGNSLLPLVKDPGGEWQEYTHTTFGLGNHTVSTERWQYIHYFDDSEELYDLQRDPNEFVNLAGDSKFAAVKERLRGYLPQEPQWKYFVRYHNFKAAIPSDGSPTLLFDLAWRNDVNEQNSVAKDYPHIVEKIEDWVAANNPDTKFLVMAASPDQASEGPGSFDLAEIERDRILDKASAYLEEAPVTVTASRAERSTGGVHDFYSEGDYWWPDPENPKGPYVRRDGMTNPDNFVAHRRAMVRLSEIVGTLASAYVITGEDRYASHANAHLRAWFVDETTRMNPNLLYGQAIKGRHTGRSIGIIDTIHLAEVARGAKLLGERSALPAGDFQAIKGWFGEYLDWLTTHPYGQRERVHPNNHGVCWSMQVAAFADLVGREDLLAWIRNQFKTVYLQEMMAADGGFPAELARTKPYGYSLFVLDAMAGVAQITSTEEDDLWAFELPDGRSLRKGLAFLYPYMQDKSSWPYRKDVLYWDDWPVRHPSLLFAGLNFGESEYLDLWKRLDPDPVVPEVIRNLPLRHPLLWVKQ